MVGLAYGTLWMWVLEKSFVPGSNELTVRLVYYSGLLLPLRLFEWGLTIWLFFDRGLMKKPRLFK